VKQNSDSHVYKERIRSLEKALDHTLNLLACLNIDEKDVKKHMAVSNQVDKCRYLLKKKDIAG